MTDQTGIRTDQTVIVEGSHYGQARDALRDDPVIKDMAAQLAQSGRPVTDWTHESGGVRHEFMVRALDQYKRLCELNKREPVGTHIGGPAEVILTLAYPDEPKSETVLPPDRPNTSTSSTTTEEPTDIQED